MNTICAANPCPILLSSSCVFYKGSNLICTGINTNDTLESALTKINNAICATPALTTPLQAVVNVENTIVMPTTVAKGIDMTMANLATVYQIGTMVTIPAQTGSPFPTYNPAPDAFLARINGQSPGTLVGFVGGFVSEATGADNVGFFAASDTGAQDSIGFFSRSTDAHTGDHFLATKIISGNSTPVFKVENDGTIKGKKLIVNTTFDNGVDSLQIEGSGFFQNKLRSQEGLLELGEDGSSPPTTLYAGIPGFGFYVTRASGANFGIDDNEGFTSNRSITGTQYKISALNTAPASATATGTTGEIRITSTYIYVCIATNTWVRTALTTW